MSQFLQFDFTDPSDSVTPCRFVDPVEIVCARRVEEVLPTLRRVQEAVQGGLYAAGFVAYEAAPAFDPAMATPTDRSELPLIWFGLYTAPSPTDEMPVPDHTFNSGNWACTVSEAQFAAEIASIRESIAAGDVYQVNHTLRLRAGFAGDPFAWYHQLRAAQGAAYSAYLDIGRYQILSLSPELFFSIEPTLNDNANSCTLSRRNVPAEIASPLAVRTSSPSSCPKEFLSERTIVTRPMKGTHARGRWPEEDIAFHKRLRNSEKERAENLMIVDLLRNDLGRIACTGSVTVDELFQVERYPTLLQMTSTISAKLRGDVGLTEMFSALFPCGSVTGAPKIAAMRRIAELEPEPRGVYCGAIGYLEPGGRSVFSVAIRTVVLDKETNISRYGVGSGITWDSNAEAEAAENRLKAAVLTAIPERLDLFETLRLEEGAYSRLERHLSRILASADYYGIAADPETLRAALEQLAQNRPNGRWRARLLLSATGEVSTECLALEDPPGPARTFSMTTQPVSRKDRRLFHKMADRSLYTVRKAERPDVYDVLLQNVEGELTEFTTGNLVMDIDGMDIAGTRFTAPLDCGLLPGALRAELLEKGEIQERVLTLADLSQARRIWLINSLRGWVPMHMSAE